MSDCSPGELYCLLGNVVSPVEMLEGVGQLQAREEEHGLQELLQLVERLHVPRVHAALLDHQVDVLGESLTHLYRAVPKLRHNSTIQPIQFCLKHNRITLFMK